MEKKFVIENEKWELKDLKKKLKRIKINIIVEKLRELKDRKLVGKSDIW